MHRYQISELAGSVEGTRRYLRYRSQKQLQAHNRICTRVSFSPSPSYSSCLSTPRWHVREKREEEGPPKSTIAGSNLAGHLVRSRCQTSPFSGGVARASLQPVPIQIQFIALSWHQGNQLAFFCSLYALVPPGAEGTQTLLYLIPASHRRVITKALDLFLVGWSLVWASLDHGGAMGVVSAAGRGRC